MALDYLLSDTQVGEGLSQALIKQMHFNECIMEVMNLFHCIEYTCI